MRALVVIGAGASGMAAAISAHDSGVKDILIIERGPEMGGILTQCIHSGFGLHTFHEELTGPEYADRFQQEVLKRGIDVLLNTTVLEIDSHFIRYINSTGIYEEECQAIVLAMGSRERARGALNIPGERPAGIFSAGTAQHLMNLDGCRIGKEVVILGSGDIGLIMARRLTLEGSHVLAVIEIMPYSEGLKRNIVQCLEDFSIPLYLSHTITEIKGRKRVEGVTVSPVDENLQPLPDRSFDIPCDTLLLSVGLLPENELTKKAGAELSSTGGPVVDDSYETSLPGVFAAGNVLHIHDLVDYVSQEAEEAGRNAARYILSGGCAEACIPVVPGHGVRYAVPQFISRTGKDALIKFRIAKPMRNTVISLISDGRIIKRMRKKVVSPGEMERVSVQKSLIDSELKLEVAENDET